MELLWLVSKDANEDVVTQFLLNRESLHLLVRRQYLYKGWCRCRNTVKFVAYTWNFASMRGLCQQWPLDGYEFGSHQPQKVLYRYIPCWGSQWHMLFLFLKIKGHEDPKELRFQNNIKTEFIFMIIVFPPPALQILLQFDVWDNFTFRIIKVSQII